MDIDTKNRLVKIFFRVLLVVIFLLVLNWAWQYLHNGKIIITTDNKNAIISLERINENAPTEKVAEGSNGKLSVSVPAGSYRMQVGEKMVQTAKTVDLKARKTEKHKLNPVEQRSFDPVATISAESMHVFDSTLMYTDATGRLQKMTSNSLGEVISDTLFNTVVWGDKGVGVGADLKQNLYMIQGNSITGLNPPEEIKEQTAVNYTISEDNNVYVAIGPNVYSMGAPGVYKKIHTTSAPSPRLSASKDKLAVYYPPQPGEGHSEEKVVTPFVEVISSDGQTIAKQDISAHSIGWSPDGTRIVAIDYFGKDKLFDPSLKNVVDLPKDNIEKFAWLDKNTLIYNTSGLLWSYSVQDKSSVLTAYLSTGTEIGDLTINSAKSVVFVQTSFNNKRLVQKLAIKDNANTPHTERLPFYLPRRLSGCAVDYINFISPTILVTPLPGKGFAECTTVATDYLYDSGINASIFNFVSAPYRD